MLTILNLDNSNIIATRASGWLDKDDYDVLIPMLERKLETNGKLSWYFEMEDDFKGWTPGAAWDDLKFDFSHAKEMERIAMVGNSLMEKILTTLMKPFTKAEVKYFDLAEKDKAMKWITEPVESTR